MPGINNPDQEPRQKRPFIREKVERPPLTRRQIIGRVFMFVFIAVLGGAAAGVSFAVARPLAERYLVQEETTESIPVTIPRDEETQSTQATQPSQPSQTLPPETTEEETSQEETQSQPPETEPIEDILQSAIEEYQYTANDLNSMYSSLKSVVTEADKGIVVVHSVKQEVDWFDNPVEVSGMYAGVIIASTSQELLILTPESAVENADSIKVTFIDNTETDGTIKQIDTVSGMAVVSVDIYTLGESTRENAAVLQLGNSYSVRQGDLVAAIGAPSGNVHSSTYGFISYVLRNVQVADNSTRLLFADIKGNGGAGTFLINISGEVVGWVTDEYTSEQSTNMTTVMAISDYKTNLEKMSNGVPIPYLGIKGQEVSTAMNESGMPLGVYVAECILDSPVYNAGIQNGDVIVKLGDKTIASMKDYQNGMEQLNRGDEITVVVQRKGIDEYKQLEYQVIVGAR